MFGANQAESIYASAHEFNRKVHEELSAPFLAGASSASIDSAANVSAIIAGAHRIGAHLLEQMTSLKKTSDDELAAHQAAQKAEQTYDFVTGMDDLRNTIARGFPEEMAERFFSVFNMKG